MSTGKHKFLLTHRRAIVKGIYSILFSDALDRVRLLITLILHRLKCKIATGNSCTAPGMMMLIVYLSSFMFTARRKFGRWSTNGCLAFRCAISTSMLRRSKLGWRCYCSCNGFMIGEMPFMLKVTLLLDMFLAAFYTGIIKNFELGTGTLHFGLMIFLVVHDPGALRSYCKVLWIIATKIRRNVTSRCIDFCKSRSTRHRIELRRILI